MSVYVRAYGDRDPVLDCLLQGKRLGFQPLGAIPGGFRMKDGHYEDICPYYHTL